MIDMAKHKISKGDLTTASMLTNMSVVKAYNYLVKQTAADSTIKHTLSTYADYMNMAKGQDITRMQNRSTSRKTLKRHTVM